MPDETQAGAGEPRDDFDVPVDDGSGSQPPTAGQLQQQQQTQDQAQDAGNIPTDLAEIMRREKLPQIPGETPEAAYTRLSTHLYRKNSALNFQLKGLKESERQRGRQIDELRSSLEPMIRDYYQRSHMAMVEQQEAEIPPKDSPEYAVWLNEQVLRRLDAYERGAEEQAKTQEELAAEQAVLQRLSQLDESGYGKVAEGLGLVQGVEADPDFSAAYDVYSEAATIAATNYFPEATEEQIHEFVALSQQLDIRRAEMNGVDIRDVMKHRMDHLIGSLERRGLVQRVSKSAGNGNQLQQPAQQQQQQTRRTAPAQPTRTVTQTVRADAAAAQRRAPAAVASTTRPSAGSSLPDPSGLDEDDYVEAVLAGLMGKEEERASPHRKQR